MNVRTHICNLRTCTHTATNRYTHAKNVCCASLTPLLMYKNVRIHTHTHIIIIITHERTQRLCRKTAQASRPTHRFVLNSYFRYNRQEFQKRKRVENRHRQWLFSVASFRVNKTATHSTTKNGKCTARNNINNNNAQATTASCFLFSKVYKLTRMRRRVLTVTKTKTRA